MLGEKKGNEGEFCFCLLGEKKCRREKISKIEYDCYTFIRKSRVITLLYTYFASPLA